MTDSNENKMAGKTDLEELLSSLAPALLDGEYVFCSFKNAQYGDYKELAPMATFVEAEGLTLVILKNHADEFGFSYDSVFKCLTLTVYSSLDAVGLTAAVSAKLAEHNISANIIAAYHHDHIFVQMEHAVHALSILNDFTC